MREGVAHVIAFTKRKIGLEEVLDVLLQPLGNPSNQGKDEQYTVFDVWFMIVKTAEETSYEEQEPILYLCEAIKQRKVPIDENSKRSWRLQDDSIYEDERPPPFLGSIIREELDCILDQSDAFSNLCTFSALLTNWKRTNLGDFTLHGLWMIREALEQVESIEKDKADQSLINKVKAARIWLEVCGQRMFQASKANEPFPGNMRAIGEGAKSALNNDIKGFSKERWLYWKLRLEKMINDDNKYPEILKIECEAALDAMVKSENEEKMTV